MFNEEAADHIREEFEALSAAWERSIVANDAEAIGRFMAADWVIVSETGITKKGDFSS
jgi:ketosteroid isomerase-like protein